MVFCSPVTSSTPLYLPLRGGGHFWHANSAFLADSCHDGRIPENAEPLPPVDASHDVLAKESSTTLLFSSAIMPARVHQAMEAREHGVSRRAGGSEGRMMAQWPSRWRMVEQERNRSVWSMSVVVNSPVCSASTTRIAQTNKNAAKNNITRPSMEKDEANTSGDPQVHSPPLEVHLTCIRQVWEDRVRVRLRVTNDCPEQAIAFSMASPSLSSRHSVFSAEPPVLVSVPGSGSGSGFTFSVFPNLTPPSDLDEWKHIWEEERLLHSHLSSSTSFSFPSSLPSTTTPNTNTTTRTHNNCVTATTTTRMRHVNVSPWSSWAKTWEWHCVPHHLSAGFTPKL